MMNALQQMPHMMPCNTIVYNASYDALQHRGCMMHASTDASYHALQHTILFI